MLKSSLKYGGLLLIGLTILARFVNYLAYQQIISQFYFFEYFRSIFLGLLATILVGIAFFNEKKSVIWIALLVVFGIQVLTLIQEYRNLLAYLNRLFNPIVLRTLFYVLRSLVVLIGLIFIQKTWGKIMVLVGNVIIILASSFVFLRYIVFEWLRNTRTLLYTLNVFLGTASIVLFGLLVIGFILHYYYGTSTIRHTEVTTPEEITFSDF